jgi:hypothetical protein
MTGTRKVHREQNFTNYELYITRRIGIWLIEDFILMAQALWHQQSI